MSRLKQTFLIKEAAPLAGDKPQLPAQGKKQALRALEAAFSNAGYSLLQDNRAAAASRLRQASTEIQMILERMAQEILQ